MNFQEEYCALLLKNSANVRVSSAPLRGTYVSSFPFNFLILPVTFQINRSPRALTSTCTFPVFKKFSTFSTFRMLKTRVENVRNFGVFGVFCRFSDVENLCVFCFYVKILFSNFAVSADFQHTKFVEFMIFPSFRRFSADFCGNTFEEIRSIFFLHFGKNIHFRGFHRFGLPPQSVGFS